MNRSILFSTPAFVLSALLASGAVLAESHAASPHNNNEASQACSEKQSCMTEDGKCACSKHRYGKHMSGKHQRGPRSGPDMQAMRERMNQLDLSEQQQQDMAALMQVYGPRFKEIAERGNADREALLQMAPDADGYDAQVAAVSKEAGNSAAEVVTLLGELQTNAYALLTPDQQAEFQALKVKLRDKRDEWQAKRAEARKGSNGKGCSHTARPGCAQTQDAPETQP
jgi:Spy/CpxP family protein refolding chaperone